MQPSDKPPARIDLSAVELIQATYTEKSILRNLLELYCYDMSEYEDRHVNAHGLYGYRYLDHYWTEAGRTPLLLRVQSNWGGFALVRTMTDASGQHEHHMAEFFIMKCFRNHGIGRHVAHTLFDRFPGPWSLMIVPRNGPAQSFWRKTVGAYIGDNFQEATDSRDQALFIKFVAPSHQRAN